MKKLAIVAVALVLAMVFVGCSASSLLPGSTWDYFWNGDSTAGNSSRFIFEADGVIKVFDCAIVLGEVVSEAAASTGDWTLDGDIITIENLMPRYNGEWTISSINMNTMEWKRDPESETADVVFQRVKN